MRLNLKRSRKKRSPRIMSVAVMGATLPLSATMVRPGLPLPTHPQMAIIIDDAGNRMPGTDSLLALKEPLTIAIMPFLSTSREDAVRAHKAGDEVILHLPMEASRVPRNWLGPGAITTSMSDEQIRAQVRADIESVPYVVGLNNHMGSKATSNLRVARDVAQVAKEKGIFIVDSRTSYRSKLGQAAREYGVPYLARSLFLDDDHADYQVRVQMHHLLQDAKRNGWSVGIGHVGTFGENTYRGIRSVLPEIHRAGVEIVPVSSLVRRTSEFHEEARKGC